MLLTGRINLWTIRLDQRTDNPDNLGLYSGPRTQELVVMAVYGILK